MRRTLIALLGILTLAAACGDSSSSGYWQNPRDDMRFEGWEQPEEEVTESPVSSGCADACVEVDLCYQLLAEQKMNPFTFPVDLSGGKCVVACQAEFFPGYVWDCLAKTENKTDEDGNVVSNYCSLKGSNCWIEPNP